MTVIGRVWTNYKLVSMNGVDDSDGMINEPQSHELVTLADLSEPYRSMLEAAIKAAAPIQDEGFFV